MSKTPERDAEIAVFLEDEVIPFLRRTVAACEGRHIVHECDVQSIHEEAEALLIDAGKWKMANKVTLGLDKEPGVRPIYLDQRGLALLIDRQTVGRVVRRDFMSYDIYVGDGPQVAHIRGGMPDVISWCEKHVPALVKDDKRQTAARAAGIGGGEGARLNEAEKAWVESLHRKPPAGIGGGE